MDIIRRILVTGTEGYLGSLLAPELIWQGYEVIGLDTGFYKERAFYRNSGATALTLAKDLRHVEPKELKDVDAVIHNPNFPTIRLGSWRQLFSGTSPGTCRSNRGGKGHRIMDSL